ncbi:hypothetical protein CKAN_00555400 [Cinnamomum micranthum f. kanehirae]|uniref:Uncharacterized protein n=1 Tax=Cinnamomum micranthum f. kanehirae TaxID=337451 RepID=A0A3S3NCQ4_9MAGN|nr:hypothetical protein CKAN_00555400 [Cinnamomum micranthum f. kanehirae]
MPETSHSRRITTGIPSTTD